MLSKTSDSITDLPHSCLQFTSSISTDNSSPRVKQKFLAAFNQHSYWPSSSPRRGDRKAQSSPTTTVTNKRGINAKCFWFVRKEIGLCVWVVNDDFYSIYYKLFHTIIDISPLSSDRNTIFYKVLYKQFPTAGEGKGERRRKSVWWKLEGESIELKEVDSGTPQYKSD